MADNRDDFFNEQKPWSRLKNRILGSYLPPYLAKVARRSERIVLVDAFAGPGRFLDSSAGSPLIICKTAEQFARGKYDAYFFNNKRSHHEMLSSILAKKGLDSARPIYGDAIEQLRRLVDGLRDETLFLYLDPFGLNCEFEILRPLLERNKRFSTEILINLHMPISHRLGSRHRVRCAGIEDSRIQSYHDKLTRVYGGDYWEDILIWRDFETTKERERELVSSYREKLSSTGYLSFTGACPIHEKSDSATKYAMVFASPHQDALLLLNDNMCKSFHEHMHNQWAKDSMFADSSWTEWRDANRIREIALHHVQEFPGETRKELWLRIVRKHFMLFTKSEFGKAVQYLHDNGKIECTTPVEKGGIRPTKKLNDECAFKPSEQQTMF